MCKYHICHKDSATRNGDREIICNCTHWFEFSVGLQMGHISLKLLNQLKTFICSIHKHFLLYCQKLIQKENNPRISGTVSESL